MRFSDTSKRKKLNNLPGKYNETNYTLPAQRIVGRKRNIHFIEAILEVEALRDDPNNGCEGDWGYS